MDEASVERLRALGNWIRGLRTMRGLTQEELAQQAGIDAGLLGIIERGERNWGIAHIWPIAEALGISVNELFRPVDQTLPPRPRGVGPRLRRARPRDLE